MLLCRGIAIPDVRVTQLQMMRQHLATDKAYTMHGYLQRIAKKSRRVTVFGRVTVSTAEYIVFHRDYNLALNRSEQPGDWRKITSQNCRTADEWLSVISNWDGRLQSETPAKRIVLLNPIYTAAFESVQQNASRENKQSSEAFGQLLTNYALLISASKGVAEGRKWFMIAMTEACLVVDVYLAAAEFELNLGEINNAMTILKKALDKKVSPENRITSMLATLSDISNSGSIKRSLINDHSAASVIRRQPLHEITPQSSNCAAAVDTPSSIQNGSTFKAARSVCPQACRVPLTSISDDDADHTDHKHVLRSGGDDVKTAGNGYSSNVPQEAAAAQTKSIKSTVARTVPSTNLEIWNPSTGRAGRVPLGWKQQIVDSDDEDNSSCKSGVVANIKLKSSTEASRDFKLPVSSAVSQEVSRIDSDKLVSTVLTNYTVDSSIRTATCDTSSTIPTLNQSSNRSVVTLCSSRSTDLSTGRPVGFPSPPVSMAGPASFPTAQECHLSGFLLPRSTAESFSSRTSQPTALGTNLSLAGHMPCVAGNKPPVITIPTVREFLPMPVPPILSYMSECSSVQQELPGSVSSCVNAKSSQSDNCVNSAVPHSDTYVNAAVPHSGTLVNAAGSQSGTFVNFAFPHSGTFMNSANSVGIGNQSSQLRSNYLVAPRVTNCNSVFQSSQATTSISSKHADNCSPPCKLKTLLQNPNYRIINGQRYLLLNLIGRGGSSKVYEALGPGLKLYALKCVNLDCDDKSIVASYRNEISLLQRLQEHSVIVKLYDHAFDESEEKLYLVMERGETDLSSFFHNNSANQLVLPSFIKSCWIQMLQAVQILHQQGIVHSDLKPANFILVSGVVKLIDFGIAKAIQADKTSITCDQIVGTFNYMSPEAVIDLSDGNGSSRNIKVGTKSDVWSLGCILYLLVYGRTPFHAIGNPALKLQAITDVRHEIAFASTDLASADVIDVLKKCLDRNARTRAGVDELLRHPFVLSR